MKAFVIIATLLIVGCDSSEHQAKFSLPPQAAAEVLRIHQTLSQNQPLPADDFKSLQALLLKFPQEELVRRTYKVALIKRADWPTLESYLLSIPLEQLGFDDRKTLAVVSWRLAKYPELVSHAQALSKTQPNDLEVVKMLATGHFFQAQYSEAAQALDANWQQIIAGKRSEEIILRGQIYQRLGESEKASATFSKGLEFDPNNRVALLALSRIHYAQGNLEQAELLRKQSEDAQARATQTENEQIQLVALIHQLKLDWAANNYAAVIKSARQAMAIAPKQNMPVLLEYIVESHRRLGQVVAAQAAERELELARQ